VTNPAIVRVGPSSLGDAQAIWDALARERILPFAGENAHDALEGRLRSDNRLVLCALIDSAPVGLSMFERTADGRIRLEAVAVTPAHRSRGIGAALLTQGLMAMLPASAMFVRMRESDKAAIGWARERSFRPSRLAGDALEPGIVEYELRLDAPAFGCGSQGGCECGAGGCAH
jgi:ribosomal protein S18 acetylase RimI-like enzyme